MVNGTFMLLLDTFSFVNTQENTRSDKFQSTFSFRAKRARRIENLVSSSDPAPRDCIEDNCCKS